MTKYLESDCFENSILTVAKMMLVAAKTAPKARGIDNLEMLIIDGSEILSLSAKMHEIAGEREFFHRDAENILFSKSVVLIGTRISSIGLLGCGLCGFENCDAKNLLTPCVFNTGDLGIAIGSAVSIAMDNRIDNRVMFSVGKAAIQLGLFASDVKIAYGIPLSVSRKNPFFDRK
ncbi:MAG: DUF2148 domain-containing protein [Bacteroidota bacterium]